MNRQAAILKGISSLAQCLQKDLEAMAEFDQKGLWAVGERDQELQHRIAQAEKILKQLKVTDMKDLLNKQILVTRDTGSRYRGKLAGFRNDMKEFCITGLVIINYAGGTTCPKHNNVRWFRVGECTVEAIEGE